MNAKDRLVEITNPFCRGAQQKDIIKAILAELPSLCEVDEQSIFIRISNYDINDLLHAYRVGETNMNPVREGIASALSKADIIKIKE